jgi:hypothetical protein
MIAGCCPGIHALLIDGLVSPADVAAGLVVHVAIGGWAAGPRVVLASPLHGTVSLMKELQDEKQAAARRLDDERRSQEVRVIVCVCAGVVACVWLQASSFTRVHACAQAASASANAWLCMFARAHAQPFVHPLHSTHAHRSSGSLPVASHGGGGEPQGAAAQRACQRGRLCQRQAGPAAQAGGGEGAAPQAVQKPQEDWP